MAQIYNFDNKGGVFFDNSGSTFYFDPWKEAEKPSEPQPSESAEAEVPDSREEGSAGSAGTAGSTGAGGQQGPAGTNGSFGATASDPQQGTAGTDQAAGTAGSTGAGGQQGSAGAGTDRMTDTKAGEETDGRQEAAIESEAGQLTNRQIVILMASLMGISLSPTETSHSELSRFLSRLTGRSHQSLRQSIISYANEGLDKASAKRDARLVASLVERFCPQVAERIRCDAEE